MDRLISQAGRRGANMILHNNIGDVSVCRRGAGQPATSCRAWALTIVLAMMLWGATPSALMPGGGTAEAGEAQARETPARETWTRETWAREPRGGGFDLDVARYLGEVPRSPRTRLPEALAGENDAETRKALFFAAVLPHILAVEQQIEANRRRLLALNSKLLNGEPVLAEEAQFLRALAVEYRVAPGSDGLIDLARLIPRVDSVPVSLALAQAALESGWGASRFAQDGNALFGQITSGDGMDTGAADLAEAGYAIRQFDGLAQSIRGYIVNLGRHAAYTDFRDARDRLRLAGAPLDPMALLPHLEPYCGCGPDYPEQLRQIIIDNHLVDFDGATLTTGPRAAPP